MICFLHYEQRPCEECARTAFLRRVAAGEVRANPAVTSPAVIVFKPVVLEHMFHPWETPRTFDSPRELRKACEERGVTSHYLRDSSLWRARDPRW